MIIVLIFTLSTAAAFSNSGDGEWEYHKNIIIKENSGEILTDYQIVVELNNLNFPIETKTDGSDIRFSDENGIELNYWIEEWNYPCTAKIWVNVQNIPANAEIKLLMYYGNPLAVSSSNGEATFVFFDDFDGENLDLVKWHQGAFGRDGIDILSYSDSVLMFRGSGCGGGFNDWRYAKSNEKWNGDEIALRAKTKRSNGISYVGFGYDSSISDNINYFHIGFDPVSGENRLDTFVSAFNPDVGIYKSNQYFYNMVPETWYIVDLMKNENILRGRISDSTGNELTTTERTDIDRNGDVFLSLCGVYNCITVRYYYDWIFVRKYANDEPTIIGITPLVANPGGPYTGNEGESIAFDASASSHGNPDRSIVSYEWDFGDGTTFTGINPSHTYADNQEYIATLTVTDDNVPAITDTKRVTVTVNNVAPVITSIIGPSGPLALGNSASVTASFTDAGSQDTHTCTISWNDGTSSQGIVTESEGSCTGSQKYASAGVYTVEITVIDDDGGSATSRFEYVVIYDPSAGFVTGGGWIYSPAGASAQYPDTEGKATFGFVSKYKKGATVPTGNTQFNFNVGNINFHSDNYDWLVIAGHKAMYKGTGTIYDDGHYGFMLSAIDEKLTPSTDVDMFRIRIWDKDNGDAVVYDNNIGNDDDADPTTALGGGTIIIHEVK
jgi:Domain of unknown function (DUF2341)/PKD domain